MAGNNCLEFEKPIYELEKKIQELMQMGEEEKIDFSREINQLKQKCTQLKKEIYGHLSSWQRVQMARHPQRLYTRDYIKELMTNFVELHGDRLFSDDRAIVGGLARFEGQSVVVVGHQKGRTTQENLERNFGMPHPEGYRKGLRLMRLAEKFSFPVISFVDTPGAYPGIGAEERGQGEAIASNLKAMALLRVPFIVLIIGEGGSGGALAISVGDRLVMLENAIYSVISPEGCASILWRNAEKAGEAAETLKLTAHDLKELKVVDEVIPEPLGGVHRDPPFVIERLRKSIRKALKELSSLPVDKLLERRYQKFRKMGAFLEPGEKKQKRVQGCRKPRNVNSKN